LMTCDTVDTETEALRATSRILVIGLAALQGTQRTGAIGIEYDG